MTDPTKKTLPGISDIGLPYDITKEYASTSALGTTPLFDFGFSPSGWNADDGDADSTQLYDGQTYYFPAGLYTVIPKLQAESRASETKSMQSLNRSLKVGISGHGRYGLFRGSVDANLDLNYASSALFRSASNRNKVMAYRLAFQQPDQLQQYLTDSARADINGDTDLTADQLILKYGTHVLISGLYGGIQTYTQSVSLLETESNAAADTTVTGNYGAFGGAKIYGSVTSANNASDEQSNGYFYAIGGTADALRSSYTDWAASVQNGNFALIAFESDTPLLPLSALASDPARQQLLLDAINDYVAEKSSPLNARTRLAWDESRKIVKDIGDTSKSIQTTVKAESNTQVIVGFGTRVHDKKCDHCFARVLDLNVPADTGTPHYKYLFSDDTQSYSSSNYERPLDLYGDRHLKNIVVTGVGLGASGKNIDRTWLYYQKLQPFAESSGFLDQEVLVEKNGSSTPEKQYSPPDPSAGYVVVEIGTVVSSGGNNIERLRLVLAPLIQIKDEYDGD